MKRAQAPRGVSKRGRRENASLVVSATREGRNFTAVLVNPTARARTMASSTPPSEGRAKRRTRPPSKLDVGAGDFSAAELQRAIHASVKLQRRTSSTAVPECPTFRPTPEQFRDPFAYIKSITPEGAKAGIAKIIPPEGTRATPTE